MDVTKQYRHITEIFWSRDSSVGIATGYGVDRRGEIPGRVQIFLFSVASRPALGHIQPLIQWVQGVLSLGLKWLEKTV
jgi:hypothetical protein